MATNYINRIGQAPVWGRKTTTPTTPTASTWTPGPTPQFTSGTPFGQADVIPIARQIAKYWMPGYEWTAESNEGKSLQNIVTYLSNYKPDSTQLSQFKRDLNWVKSPTSLPEWYTVQTGGTPGIPPAVPVNPNPQPGTGTTPTPPSTTTPVAQQPNYMQWLQGWLSGTNPQMPTTDGGQQAGNSLGAFLGTPTWAQNSDWFNQPSLRQGAEAWANVMMPYAQLMQNSWQYSQDFNEAQRRFNEQQAWQKAQDAANMQMAQEQLSQNLQSIWGRNQTPNVRWYRNY